MEIRFILTREDFWHFLTYLYFKRLHRVLGALLVLYLVWTLVIVIMSGPSFSPVELWPLLVFLVIPVLLVFRMRRIAARGAGRGGEHVVSITPEGMREKTDLAEGIRFWRTFKTIDQDSSNLYLLVDNIDSRAVAATIIPRRAFATPQEAEMFLEQARHYWVQGRAILPGERQEGSPSHGL